MSLFAATLVLASSLQAVETGQPILPDDPVCPEINRIELSRSSAASALELCVSPGIMTGIIFDLPVEVEIQEELRFMGILLGRNEISFRPPHDLAPGERLRLTAKLGTGEARQTVTFFLVSYPGHATHQVEVYHDSRPRESLLLEIAEERAKNQQLQEENRRLAEEMKANRLALQRFTGLTGAHLSHALSATGIQAKTLSVRKLPTGVSATSATSYHSFTAVALEVLIQNLSPEAWVATDGSLFDSKGNKLDGLVLSVTEKIAPNAFGTVFLEAAGPLNEPQETYTLRLFEDGPRTVTVHQIVFPPIGSP